VNKLILNDLSFKDVKTTKDKIGAVYDEFNNLKVKEKPAKMPGRENVDLEEFSVSVYSVSGQMINFGDVKNKHTL